MSSRTTLAVGSRTCPICGRTDEQLPHHWNSGSCPWPNVTRRQHELVIGLLLGNAAISGDSANEYLQLVATNQTFATWVFEELDWLSDSLVRVDPPKPTDQTEHALNHCYRVRTRVHPELASYRKWDNASSEKRIPLHLDLPARSARVWYACSGELHWQDDGYPLAVFTACDDKRANRIAGLIERAEFEPTRTGTQVRLPPRETRAFLEWIGDPVPGVGYKWTTERAIHDDLRREQRAERWWLALHPESENRLRPDKRRVKRSQSG
jgi:hypothetical protein